MSREASVGAAPIEVSADLASTGLSSQQLAERRQGGLTNQQGKQPTRTVSQILRANVLTRFNAILLALLVVILIVGPYQDALFGLILIANSGIGIIQELRAKRTLDHLSVLNTPTARAVRDSETVVIPAEQVVLDDVLELRSGDCAPPGLRSTSRCSAAKPTRSLRKPATTCCLAVSS
jgi:cation-transporting P-type ATPase E